MSTEQHEQSLEEFIDIDDKQLSIELIESFAFNNSLLQTYCNECGNNDVYASILLSLTHETFVESEAKRLWYEIVNHLKLMNHCLNRNVGVVVASLDYLANIKSELIEPKLIEEDKSDFVTKASTVDELTGLYVRDVFDMMIDKKVDEMRRGASQLHLFMIDIDDFKAVNDEHGHQKGDEVLSCVGKAINDSIREMDLAARYGGEELVVLMPDANKEQVLSAAERIRSKVASIEDAGVFVTVSIGVAAVSDQLNTSSELMRCADEAMYDAKRSGKDKVVFHLQK